MDTSKAVEVTVPIECACAFCEEFDRHPALPNRVMWEGNGLVLLPSMGSFTPGYLLLMPRSHVRSFAELPAHRLKAALAIAEQVRMVIAKRFGPTIIAEHGPGTMDASSSACCDHAHWHLIPSEVFAVATTYHGVGGSPVPLRNGLHLRRWAGRPYIFLSPLPGVSWIWPHSSVFPSQFVRRVSASVQGLEEFYDWGVFPFTENMLVTRERLEHDISRVLSSWSQGSEKKVAYA